MGVKERNAVQEYNDAQNARIEVAYVQDRYQNVVVVEGMWKFYFC